MADQVTKLNNNRPNVDYSSQRHRKRKLYDSTLHPDPPPLPDSLVAELFERIQPHLERLSDVSLALKISTIQEIALRRILGKPFDTKEFWGKKNKFGGKLTCSRATYQKWRSPRIGDPAFTNVLQDVLREVELFRTSESAAAITEAITMMQLAAPEMVQVVFNVIERAMYNGRDADALKGAFGILDRASTLSANKSGGNNITFNAPGDGIRSIIAEADQELEEWEAAIIIDGDDDGDMPPSGIEPDEEE